MSVFRYVAIDAAGERRAGVLTAASRDAALADLAQRHLTPVSIDAAKSAAPGDAAVPQAQLAQAYRQLADLLRAGVPLLRALRLLARRKTMPKLAQAMGKLADDVEDGAELAEAMQDAPGAFRPVHIAMVRAGEKGGFLESSLARLAAFVQGQVELRRKVVGSAIYPASIASLGGLLILALLVFFIPQFGSLYEDVDTPLLTDVLLGASAALTSRWYVGVVVIVLAAVGVRQLLKSPAVRRRVIATLVRTPKLGPLLRDLAVARFARVLGTLLAAGVPMLQALKIARDAAGYAEVASTIDAATDAVRAGEPLATPLQESIFFEDDTVEILAVAEQANNLEEVLVTLADTLEQRVDRQLTIVVRLIEPILLLAIAGVIVLVALGLILPMLKLTSGLDV